MRRFLPRKKIQETFEQDNFMSYFTDTIDTIDTIDTLLNKTIARWKNPSSPSHRENFKL